MCPVSPTDFEQAAISPSNERTMVMDSSSGDRDPLELLAEEFLERRRRGESPSIEEYAGKYPELADGIREVFPALEIIEEADPVTVELAAASADIHATRLLPAACQNGEGLFS